MTAPTTSLPATVDPTGAQRARLRRMKAGAAGLLLVAAALYALTFQVRGGGAGGWGIQPARAEAGMVGGLADWFAVTALFRRPLGLPIPHTAIIPTRKDALARALGEFVTGNFVTADNLRLHLAHARLIPRTADWLLAPGRAQGLVRRGLADVGALRSTLRAEPVADILLDIVRRDAARRSYAGVAGGLLADFTDTGQHRPVLDTVLPYLRAALAANRPVAAGLLRTLADDRLGILSLFVSDKRLASLLDGVEQTLGDMSVDRRHPVRRSLDEFLAKVARDLQHDSQLQTALDSVVDRFLDDPQTRDWWVAVADGALSAVQAAVADPEGAFATAAVRTLTELAERARDDAAFARRLEERLEELVVHLAGAYGSEVTSLIEQTVQRWDGADAADKIELAAGRDLQFIRVNGTMVGALAGVVIHALSLL